MILFLVMILAGCMAETSSPNPEGLTFASWNVQTFFDGVEAGNEYDEFRESRGWTPEKYQARLVAFGNAVEKMPAPDIFVLIEVENTGVLQDLIAGPLKNQQYRYSFFGVNAGFSQGIGILSRFPFTETKIHSLTGASGTTPRPMVEVRIERNEAPVVLFACHWKSKLGDAATTELLRRDSARILVRRLRELYAEDPNIPVVIMGDLNENYDEFYRSGILTAILPDDEAAAELAQDHDNFLIISDQKPPVSSNFPPEFPVLYSPWGNELTGGSYVYRDQWETIDHILLSAGCFDTIQWDFDSCEVLNQEPFASNAGIPVAYNPRTGNGLSDHLPLFLRFKFSFP
ncbi:endonuclease [Spirochaetia bacterium]|nr:endonuclease [Spirochaetia bacterium]GHU29971.1 endonuclease [Spirochaetia bacterium]